MTVAVIFNITGSSYARKVWLVYTDDLHRRAKLNL